MITDFLTLGFLQRSLAAAALTGGLCSAIGVFVVLRGLAFIGAGLWAVASHTHNHHYAARGRMAALISGAAALVVGAAPGLVNFFAHLGTTAH